MDQDTKSAHPKLKVVEIFQSIQGEGVYTGMPVTFIRLAGCNLKCDFCDTDHTVKKEMTESEILLECSKYPPTTVVITGGEPGLQDLNRLISLLQPGYTVHIESNGSLPLYMMARMADHVTISPKPGAMVDPLNQFGSMEWKYVIKADTVVNQDNGLPADCAPPLSSNPLVLLQPCDEGDDVKNKANLIRVINLCSTFNHWLSLQTHKLIGLP